MYRITLIDGANDLSFDFENAKSATMFMDEAFKRFNGRETDNGKSKLVAEIEYMEDIKENA